ncbi:MAG: MbtH family NRPS accessory protein [Vicinamibacterales bacterium]
MSSPAIPRHRVVVNGLGQYSLQPGFLPLAPGWRDAGFTGSEDDCLAYIREHWTDMTPASVRRARAAATRDSGPVA